MHTKRNASLQLRLFLLAVAALAIGCSEPDQPAAVGVAPGNVTLDAVGATKQLTATVSDSKGKVLTGATVTWASSDGAVAGVDANGLVTAVANGSADVTASAGTVSGKAVVVVGQLITKVEAVSGSQQNGTVGQTLAQQLVVRVRDRLDQPVPGVTVTFSLDPAAGTLLPASGATGADGQFAATWTLGTKSGTFQAQASVTGSALPAVFQATVSPGPADNLAAVSGNNQFGFHDTRLAQLIAVRVRDQYGNGVPSHAVQFDTVSTGNGKVDSTIAFSDTAGIARTGWVMPSAPDTVYLQARALSGAGAALLGSPVTFTAISHNVNVSATSPTPLVEGQSATITGTGFDAGNTQNVVTIDGAAAAVTAASGTDLTVTVPGYDCKPSRSVTVQVTVGGIPAAPVSKSLSAATPALSLSVGQQAMVADPAQFCFQLPPSAAAESYLIGVQSTSEAAASLTPVTLLGTTAAAAAAPGFSPVWPGATQRTPSLPLQLRERVERWRRFAAAEVRQRAFDRAFFRQARTAALRAAPQARAPAAFVPGTANVGDTLSIRVAQLNSCTKYDSIKTVVRAKGSTNFILADLANPSGGYDSTRFAGFSTQYDAKTYPTNATEFGTPTDRDGNGRIVIVVTKEVNKRGPAGFTTSCDFFPRDAVTNSASNDGEVVYVVSPDPNGVFGPKYSLQAAILGFPDIAAHESVHAIQFGRRLASGAAEFLDIWQAEGQAVLGEEVVGNAVEGRSTFQNLGLGVAINLDDTLSTDWYSTWVVGLGLYFGWDPITGIGDQHLSNAPWECTFLDVDYGGPCVGGMDPYGTSWSLLRYLSDRFGNEAAHQQAMIESPQTGFAALQSIFGVGMDTLLAQWATMLFADDSVPNIGTELKLPSWNLKNIFFGTYPFGGFNVGLKPELRLTPVNLGFTTFSQSANVRAASSYYAVITGANRPAIALKARDAGGTGLLPSQMRYWILRIQ